MADWQQKRFWTQVEIAQQELGYTVLLDGRLVKTPAKTLLALPTKALAEAVAAEWRAQVETVRPETMPYTRRANAALDKVTRQFQDVLNMLAAYGETDLLCYRAAQPAELNARQAEAWDPLLEWAGQTYGAILHSTSGVTYLAQAAESVLNLAAPMQRLSAFQLTAFHDLVTFPGSLVAALAVIEGHLKPEQAWELCRLDEIWQEEQWGIDEEATTHAALKKSDFLAAYDFFTRCG